MEIALTRKLHGSHIYMCTVMCTDSICVGTRTCVLCPPDDDVNEEEVAMCEYNIRGAKTKKKHEQKCEPALSETNTVDFRSLLIVLCGYQTLL